MRVSSTGLARELVIRDPLLAGASLLTRGLKTFPTGLTCKRSYGNRIDIRRKVPLLFQICCWKLLNRWRIVGDVFLTLFSTDVEDSSLLMPR